MLAGRHSLRGCRWAFQPADGSSSTEGGTAHRGSREGRWFGPDGKGVGNRRRESFPGQYDGGRGKLDGLRQKPAQEAIRIKGSGRWG